jgi:hypothetical protein
MWISILTSLDGFYSIWVTIYTKDKRAEHSTRYSPFTMYGRDSAVSKLAYWCIHSDMVNYLDTPNFVSAVGVDEFVRRKVMI